MKMLPNNLLMIITMKVAASGTQDLMNFSATSKLHRQLTRKKASFRALNQDCLWYIVESTTIDVNLDIKKQIQIKVH